ncbi:MAG TPA: carbonic anhydrase [Thermoanaerobaculia bacterium]|nr:carbonic anhydrase [Thermoanaerobaculia bacterium]
MRRSVRFLFVLAVVVGMGPSVAQPIPPPLQKPFTVRSLWPQLKAGNDLFASGVLRYTELNGIRRRTASGQNPPITVLACSDSRVPPELVFGRGLDDLFVVRTAGNVADTFGIASIEYGVAHHWSKVIIVLAHDRCGAVTEALKTVEPDTPSLIELVHRIRDGIKGADLGTKKRDMVRPAVIANAKASAHYLVDHSEVIKNAVDKKEVEIVVAYYGFSDGKVVRLETIR